MQNISVIPKEDGNDFLVEVVNGNTTEHVVSLNDDYYHNLTQGKMSKTELIKMSFRFLLERESNTAILRNFNLSEIKNYFSEYTDFIRGEI